MAAHFQRNVGDVVVFHDGEGKFIQSTITAKKRVIGDVAVGVLDKPLPSSYTPYPLLRARAGLEDDLKQEYILVTDKARRVFVHQVRAVYNQNIGFLFDASKKIGYGKRLIVGDSGNPSFIMVNGKQALIETHTAGGAGAGPFYGNAEVQQALASKIKELGGVGTLRYVDWPKK